MNNNKQPVRNWGNKLGESREGERGGSESGEDPSFLSVTTKTNLPVYIGGSWAFISREHAFLTRFTWTSHCLYFVSFSRPI